MTLNPGLRQTVPSTLLEDRVFVAMRQQQLPVTGGAPCMLLIAPASLIKPLLGSLCVSKGGPKGVAAHIV